MTPGGADLVIGSVHSHMNLEPAEMTDRLLTGAGVPVAQDHGHPPAAAAAAGAVPLDFERVVDEAVGRGVRFEINASPEPSTSVPICCARPKRARPVQRLDRRPSDQTSAEYAVWRDHGPPRLLGPEDIMNTLPVEEFSQLIK